MKKIVVCEECGTERKINRQNKTPKDATFWCEKCRKTVKPSDEYIAYPPKP